MQNLISILSQVAWGVTAGGLAAAAAYVAKAGGIAGGVAGCGYLLWRRRRRRAADRSE